MSDHLTVCDDPEEYPDDYPGVFVDVPPGEIAGLKWRAAMNDQSVVVADEMVFVVD